MRVYTNQAEAENTKTTVTTLWKEEVYYCGNAFFHRTTIAVGKAGRTTGSGPLSRLHWMEKRVPTKTIWEAVGSWFPALRVRFCARALRALAIAALASQLRIIIIVSGM